MCSEVVQSVFRECSDCVQSVFRLCSDCVQSMFRVFTEYVRGLVVKMGCLDWLSRLVVKSVVIASSRASRVSVFGIFILKIQFWNTGDFFHVVPQWPAGPLRSNLYNLL